MSKKSSAGGITIPNFKQLFYRAIAIKIAWYWQKNRQEDQWIRIEDADINPHIYSQLIFNKGAQNTQWRKYSLFNKGKLDVHMQKTETRSLSFTLYQNKPKVDQRSETERTLRGSRKYTGTVRYRKQLPKQNSKDSASKRNNEQMGLHQTKELRHSKGNSYQTQETTHRMGENLFQLLI
jgi:hypothetical protein